MVDSYDPLQEQLQIARTHEQNNKWEEAYRNYHDLARKALQQFANTTDPARKEHLKQLADNAITQAQWSK